MGSGRGLEIVGVVRGSQIYEIIYMYSYISYYLLLQHMQVFDGHILIAEFSTDIQHRLWVWCCNPEFIYLFIYLMSISTLYVDIAFCGNSLLGIHEAVYTSGWIFVADIMCSFSKKIQPVWSIAAQNTWTAIHACLDMRYHWIFLDGAWVVVIIFILTLKGVGLSFMDY